MIRLPVVHALQPFSTLDRLDQPHKMKSYRSPDAGLDGMQDVDNNHRIKIESKPKQFGGERILEFRQAHELWDSRR